MEIISVEEAENGIRIIVFAPDATLLNPPEGDMLDMTIRKEKLKDVVYVEKGAVHSKDGEEFVYLISPEGFLDPVYVQTGEEIEDVVVIKSGLSGGEKVAVIQ